MNISSPRTFSKTSTKISPSLNRSTRVSTSPTFMPRCIDMRRATALASVWLELPEMIFGSSSWGIGSTVLHCPFCNGFVTLTPLNTGIGSGKYSKLGSSLKMAHIDYYLATISPNCYLAGTRPPEVAAKHGATLTYKPLDIMALVFAHRAVCRPATASLAARVSFDRNRAERQTAGHADPSEARSIFRPIPRRRPMR